jgi:hypothetical protein
VVVVCLAGLIWTERGGGGGWDGWVVD